MRAVAAVFLAVVAALGTAPAQEVIRIPSEPVCPRCRIDLARVATLGRPGDPVSLMRHSRIAADSRGNYYVGPIFTPGQIGMYDPVGRFVRSFGRSGQGPGEFGGGISLLRVSRGDTLNVVEGLRHTAVPPRLGGPARLAQLPVPPLDAVFLPDGRMLVNAAVTTAGSVVQPLQLVDGGRIANSFGSDGRPFDRRDSYAQVRLLALAPDARVWAARFNRYELELWGMDGVPARRIARDADWFAPWKERDPHERWEQRPRARIAGLATDAAGRLWVSVLVPDRDWRPSPRPTGEVKVAELPPMDQTYDTILEVIDPARGRVIARQRFGQALTGFVGTGLIYGGRQDEDGNELFDVWRIRLTTH